MQSGPGGRFGSQPLELRVDFLQQQLQLEIAKRNDGMREMQQRHAADFHAIQEQLQQLRLENEALKQMQRTSASGSFGHYMCHRHGRTIDPQGFGDPHEGDVSNPGRSTILGRLSEVESRLGLCQRTIEERHSRLERAVNEYFAQHFSKESEKLRAMLNTSCRDFFASAGFYEWQQQLAAISQRVDTHLTSEIVAVVDSSTSRLSQRLTLCEDDIKQVSAKVSDVSMSTKISKALTLVDDLQRKVEFGFDGFTSNFATVKRDHDRLNDRLSLLESGLRDAQSSTQDLSSKIHSTQTGLSTLDQRLSGQLVTMHANMERLDNTRVLTAIDKLNVVVERTARDVASLQQVQAEFTALSTRVDAVQDAVSSQVRDLQSHVAASSSSLRQALSAQETELNSRVDKSVSQVRSELTSLVQSSLTPLREQQRQAGETLSRLHDVVDERVDSAVLSRHLVSSDAVRKLISDNNAGPVKSICQSTVDGALSRVTSAVETLEIAVERQLKPSVSAASTRLSEHQKTIMELRTGFEKLDSETKTAIFEVQQRSTHSGNATRNRGLDGDSHLIEEAKVKDLIRAEISETVPELVNTSVRTQIDRFKGTFERSIAANASACRELNEWKMTAEQQLESQTAALEETSQSTRLTISKLKEDVHHVKGLLTQSQQTTAHQMKEITDEWQQKLERTVKAIATDVKRSETMLQEKILDVSTVTDRMERDLRFSLQELESRQNARLTQLDSNIVALRSRHEDVSSEQSRLVTQLEQVSARSRTATPLPSGQENLKALAPRLDDLDHNIKLLFDLTRNFESRLSESSAETAEIVNRIRETLEQYASKFTELGQCIAEDRGMKLQDEAAILEILRSRHDPNQSNDISSTSALVWLTQCHANNHTVLTELLGLFRTLASGFDQVESDTRQNCVAINTLSEQLTVVCTHIGIELDFTGETDEHEPQGVIDNAHSADAIPLEAQ